MSGPWDRPSSPSPDDREQSWPAEDIQSPTSSEAPAEPWSAADPWQEGRREPVSGWDDWPATDDAYLPDLPSSDPWTESWTVDEPETGPAAAEPSWQEEPSWPPESVSQPAAEPSQEPVAEVGLGLPEPTPIRPDAWTTTDTRAIEAPAIEALAPEAPRPAPEPDPDASPGPWDTEPEVSPPAGAPEAEHRWEAAPAAPFSPPERREDAPTIEPWSPDPDPWGLGASGGWSAAAIPMPSPPVEPPVAAQPVEPAAEPSSGDWTAPAEEPELDAVAPAWTDAPAATFGRVEPPAARALPEAPAVDAVEPEPEPEPWAVQPEPEPEPEPWPALAAEPEPAVAEERTTAEAEPGLDGAGAPDRPPWAAALWGDAPAPEPEPEPDPVVVSPRWDDTDLPPLPRDATQVFPTEWVPPVPRRGPAAPAEPELEPGLDPGLEPEPGDVYTTLAERDEAVEPLVRPTNAEQAVPWLIGLILLLAGMVIVLLALIFAGDGSLGGTGSNASPTALAGLPNPSGGGSTSPGPSRSAAPSSSVAPSSTPLPAPQYGPLEMVYQGRSAALAPIYLLRHDFTTSDAPAILAQDPSFDVRRLAWSPDGTVGAGLLADVLVSIEPGKEKRRLGNGISTITFGSDGATVYAVRATQDGGNEVATVLAIDFVNGDTTEVASVSYARPDIGQEPPLKEAQFSDDGGTIRLYRTDDGALYLWSLGGGAWAIDPGTGDVTELEPHVPSLWDPDGRHQVTVIDAATSRLVLKNASGAELASTTVPGLVSHLRWSGDGERVVFTLGRLASGGGILQDLFLWDLEDGQAPMQLTSTGAAFGAEWLGAPSRWKAAG